MINRLLKFLGFKEANNKWWNESAPDMGIKIPTELVSTFQEVANTHKMTVLQLIKKYIEVGLVIEFGQQQGLEFLFRDENGDVTVIDMYSED